MDRVAASVGIKVITDSEIDLRIRLTAFQNDEKPELSVAARRIAVERLIDQKLVEREMDVGHYPRLARSAAKRCWTIMSHRTIKEIAKRSIAPGRNTD